MWTNHIISVLGGFGFGSSIVFAIFKDGKMHHIIYASLFGLILIFNIINTGS